jgi:hypothetical protein
MQIALVTGLSEVGTVIYRSLSHNFSLSFALLSRISSKNWGVVEHDPGAQQQKPTHQQVHQKVYSFSPIRLNFLRFNSAESDATIALRNSDPIHS